MKDRRQPSPSRPRAGANLLGALALLAAVLCPQEAASSEGPGSVGPEVTLLVKIPGSPGRAEPLDGSGLEIIYDGRHLPSSSIRPWDPRRDPTRVLVYVDLPLVAPEGLERAFAALARQAPALASLGDLELVVADPDPVSYLEPGRAPSAFRAALDEAARQALPGELLWQRQRYRTTLALGPPDAASARRALREELELLARQRRGLRRWLEGTCAAGGGLLLLVSDGFDPDPRRFYLLPTGEAVPSVPDERSEQQYLARRLAADGWMVVTLAMGQRTDELEGFREPLEELATQTGGELLSRPADLERLLTDLQDRSLVTVRLPGSADRTPRPLDIRVRGTGRRLTAGRWASAPPPRDTLSASAAGVADDTIHAPIGGDAANPVIRLLPPVESSRGRRLLLRAVVARRPVRRVAFFVEGEEVASLERPPWETEVAAGEPGRPRRVRAVAYCRRDHPLGEDSQVLDAGSTRLGVQILRIEGDPVTGRLRVAARVQTPADRTLERVDYYWSDRLAASRSEAPFEAEISHPSPGLDDFVRVVALLRDGEEAEDVRLLAPEHPVDRLEVNLVGVYALVSHKGRKELPRLRRSDFTLFQGQTERPVERFLDADEMPLLLGLAIDTSYSMRSLLADAKEAARRFLEQTLEMGDRSFLVDFSGRPRLLAGPSGDLRQVLGPLEALRPGGDTALYDSVAFSLLQLEGHAGRKAVVVLTDGRDEGSRLGPEDCIELSTRLGAPIFGIFPGSPPDLRRQPHRARFAEMVKRSGGSAHFVGGLRSLESSYRAIRRELRNQYYLAFSTDRELAARELAGLRVELAGRPFQVRTIPAGRHSP